MNTFTTRTRVVVLVASLAAGALLLTGCGPQPVPTTAPTSATPTPTPTASTVPAPTSESDAVASAEATIAQYLQLRGEINAAGGTETTGLDTLATGPALQLAIDDARRIAAGFTTKGALTFAPTMEYAVDLVAVDGTKYPFSSANITGCQDGSGYKVFNADGTPAQQPVNQQNVFEFNVIWDPNFKNWLVNTVIATGATC